MRRPTIGDFAPPELQKKLPLSSGYSEILDKHFRDLAIEGPGWPKCRVVEFSRMQVIGGLRDNSSEFGVFGIDFAELWVDEAGWNDAVAVWNAVTDDTVEDHPEGATVRLGTDELRLIRGAGAVRARLRAWTPFESRAGYRMRIADVEIVTTLGFSPKPFPAKVVAGDETWTALLQAEGDGVYRILQGERPFEPPLPYRSLVKLELVDGRLTLAEVVERSAWRTYSLTFYSLVGSVLDEARVDEIERRIVDGGGVVSRERFRGEVFCMHLPPGLDFDPVEELERLGFRRR